MAQRTISECDLCKCEAEDMQAITIKKPGKRKGNSYDLCTTCSQSLQSALVGDERCTIRPDNEDEAPKPARGRSRRAEVENAELDENDLLLESKGIEVEKLEDEPPVDTFADRDERTEGRFSDKVRKRQEGEPCSHANRTGPKMGTVDGRRTFYTRCKDCNVRLPMRTTDERAAFTKASTGGHDIRESEPPQGGK